MFEKLVVWLKLFEGIVSRHFQNDDHEGAHEESSVNHFGSGFAGSAVVEHSVVRVVLVSKQSRELT